MKEQGRLHVHHTHGDYTPVTWLSTAGIVPQQWAERVGERHGACAEGGGCRPTHWDAERNILISCTVILHQWRHNESWHGEGLQMERSLFFPLFVLLFQIFLLFCTIALSSQFLEGILNHSQEEKFKWKTGSLYRCGLNIPGLPFMTDLQFCWNQM